MKTQLSKPRGHLWMRAFTILVVVVVGTAVLALPAAAGPPIHYSYDWFPSGDITDVCPFPVHYDGIVHVDETDFFDNSGAVVRFQMHMVQQDTFTANGKTLVGLPYTYNLRILFDSSGNVTHMYTDGVFERILLPDGSLFISAGRVDFADYPNVSFILSPDHGNPGNVAGFCAALAP